MRATPGVFLASEDQAHPHIQPLPTTTTLTLKEKSIEMTDNSAIAHALSILNEARSEDLQGHATEISSIYRKLRELLSVILPAFPSTLEHLSMLAQSNVHLDLTARNRARTQTRETRSATCSKLCGKKKPKSVIFLRGQPMKQLREE